MHDPIPEKIAAAWKSPPRGHKDRHPTLTLVLEAEFDQTPQLLSLQPWLLMDSLLTLLGEHAVELNISGAEPSLHRLDLPFKSRPYSTILMLPLSWLSRFRNGATMDAVFHASTYGFSCEAIRGGGAHRHQVWTLELEKAHQFQPALLRLFLRTRHVPSGQIKQYHSLISQFYICAGDAGAYYGRGDYEILDDFWSRSLGRPRLSAAWTQSARRTHPLVPGVHRYNFLDASRLNKLGGLAALQERAQKARSPYSGVPLQITPIRSGVLLHADPSPPPLHVEDADLLDQRDDTQSLWLLAEFSRASMLAVQHLDWVHAAYEKSPKQAATRSRAKPKRRIPMESWLKDLRNRPPAFLKNVAQPVPPTKSRNRGGHGQQAVTEFLITPADKSRRAVTLYGAPTSGPPLLNSPIRAGSLKPQRAIFEFDLARHGWDAAQAADTQPQFPPEPRPLKQLACPRCDGRHFELRASFEYPEDLYDQDSLTPAQHQHAEDFFTWFWLHARCPACAWQGVVADIECA